MFTKKKTKKIDKIVTGMIIGTAVASIFGLSQTKKWKEVTKKSKWFFSRIYWSFGKAMCKIVSKKKKDD